MTLLNPADTLERQNEKLVQITEALMRRVEQKTEQSGVAYAQFERAALLEAEVRQRTLDLERTLDLLHEANAQLGVANRQTETARQTLTDAIETVSEGFALFDPDDKLVLSNSRFCKDLTDIKNALIPGLSFSDYVDLISHSRFLSLPESETSEHWAERRMLRHGDNHVIFNVSLIWDRWLQVSEHRTSQGGTVILQTDVTDIIRLERRERDKLRDHQAEMVSATLEHLNQGVCIFDANERLVFWNQRMSTVLDLPIQDGVIGGTFSRLLDKLSYEVTFSDTFDMGRLRNWAANRSGRRPIAFEIRSGTESILSVFAQELPDKGFVISFTDVTSEREAARALFEMNERLERRVEARTLELGDALAEAERANSSKSRFVAAASHDLLQPLSAAKLFMSSLSETVSDPASLDVIDKAETALGSVEHIIEALLDISRLDAGKAVFDIQPVALNAILTPLRDELSPVAEAKGLSLSIVPSGLTVKSDAGYLRRIIQNLVTNAIRYTDSGKIVVGVRRTALTARVEVWDTGPGIAPEDQRLVFQEFKRGDPARSANDGLGLGLAIVERACKTLDHPLELWSEPGAGSCFSVNLKLADAGSESAAGPVNGEPTANAAGLIIMLVENDEQLGRALLMMIEGWGSDVLWARTAEEALELMREIDLVPDMLLMDQHLGQGMTGLELYNEISLQEGFVPGCIISADRSKALRKECRRHEIDLLTKPIDTMRLARLLEDVSKRTFAILSETT
ncbi:hybrid sensor histidine kinase/response regulator [Litoreibacter roseus]|uniref:histidine kinase n=1 Tax=Litoreibacter roseus TaxID=2601869 RepID=A0A6N6JCZ1_9RHOB|nr:PAS-domain containing protein [Litoreibacter roseus]GFE64213.1 hybrid sensor histidine kinase/response regulator [Litoreibacter roseus]